MDYGVDEGQSEFITVLVDIAVDGILVDNSFDDGEEKAGDDFQESRVFSGEEGADVDEVAGYFNGVGHCRGIRDA